MMLAPALDPEMAPPRSNTLRNASSVFVPAYASTRRHWRPPPKKMPPAESSGAMNSSVSATAGS